MNVLEVCSSMGNERDPLHQQLLLMLPLLELQLLVRTRGMVCLVCRCYVVTKGTRGSRLLSLLVLLLLAVFSRGLATGYWPGPNNHAGTNTGQQNRKLQKKRVPKRQGSATWRGDCPFAPTRRSPSDRLGASRYSSQARGVRQVVVGEKDCGDRCDQSAAVLGNKRGLAHLLPARLLRASRTAATVWVSKNRKKKKVRTRTTTECYCSRRARGRESGVERTSWLCLPGFLMTTRPFCASVAV